MHAYDTVANLISLIINSLLTFALDVLLELSYFVGTMIGLLYIIACCETLQKLLTYSDVVMTVTFIKL